MKIDTERYSVATLEAGGATLRALSMNDGPDVFAYARDPEVSRYLLWDAHKSIEETFRYLEYVADANAAGRQMDWGIVDKATGRVVGACGLILRNAEGTLLELGYCLGKKYWGRGLATAAARALVRYAFEETPCERLVARHFPENPASGRVLEKAGFAFEGTARRAVFLRGAWMDARLYAVTRPDYAAMQPKSRAAALERLRDIACFAVDMDGTIYLGDRVLDGTLDFLALLRARGIRALFLTNNSSRSAAHYVRRLNDMGIAAGPEDILSSGQAAAAYLLREYPKRRVFVMGNRDLCESLARDGVEVVSDRPDVVLAGFDTELTYDKLTKTCDFVRAGLPFIATHPDFNCPTDGGFMPDLGSMLDLIASSTGRRPDVVIGKPNTEISRYLLARTSLPREKIAMVGDRLYTDVAAGLNAGMLSVLVLSGETKREHLAASRIQPDLVCESVAELCALLKERT